LTLKVYLIYHPYNYRTIPHEGVHMHSHHDNNRNAELLELYKPKFTANLHPDHEAGEAVLLKCIDELSDPEFAAELYNPILARKLKALLMILTHDLYTRTSVWNVKESNITYNFLNKKSELLTQAIVQSDMVTRETILNQVKSFFIVRSKLYAEIFTFDEVKLAEAIDRIHGYSYEEFQDKEDIKFSILTALTNYHYAMVIFDLKKSLAHFNIDKFEQAGNKALAANTTTLYSENNLLDEENNFDELSLEFALYHREFLDSLYKTITNMNQSFFCVLNTEVFSRLYNKAFQHIASDDIAIYKYNLIEYYLEQVRKPELRTIVRQSLVTFIVPAIITHCENFYYYEPMDFESLINLVDEFGKINSLSIHQMLNTAYLQLFSLADSQSPQIFTRLSVTNQDIKPLFENKIPGTISTEEINLVNSINTNYLQYQKLFADQDRDASITIFKENLKLADSLPKIVALTEAAHPFIDIHKHFRLDDKLGKTNTNTWSKSLKAARADAMKILKLHVDSSEDKSKTIEALEYWRGNGIFSTHRSNFKILGAFGRTKAQVEIDTMLTTLRKP
jgi:hypothetical protein